jgi:hypothetical protein
MEDILKYLNNNEFDKIIKIKNYETFSNNNNNILHLLAIRGNEVGIDYFLEKNSELLKSNNEGSNILHLLFEHGWDDLAEKYYKLYPELLYLYDTFIKSPISYCIERFETFNKCLNFIKSQNKSNKSNIIELLNNVSIYNDNIILNLIKMKYYNYIVKIIDYIDFDKPKMSPVLIYTIQNNHDILSEYFILNKKGISIKSYFYLLPINIACSKNNIKIVKLLLNEDSNVGYGGLNNEYLPLNIAINNNYIDLALILIDYIENYNTIDKYKNTYLHYISDKLIEYLENNDFENESKLKIILKKMLYKSNIDSLNNDNLTPRKLLIQYIKLKNKLKIKDSDTKKIINSINSINSIKNDKKKDNNINIIKNNKKYYNGLFNSDIFHNMLYCIYLLNKYDDLGIPFYKFDKNEYLNTIQKFEMQNIMYDKYYKVIYDILNVGIRYLYPLIPSIILWKDKNLNYINQDLFDKVYELSKKKRFIMIKISLIVGGQYTHANVVLIDCKDSSIRRFEPYGISDVDNESDIDNIIEENISKILNKKMKYYKPNEYLDLSKFQLVSNDGDNNYKKLGDPGGYCLAWCIWYIELKLNNPDVSEEELIIKATEKINKYYKNTDNPYLYFIRDYSRKLNSEKDKILKKLKFKNNELYDINYKISNLEKILYYMIDFFN